MSLVVRKPVPPKVSKEELLRHAEATQRLFEGRGGPRSNNKTQSKREGEEQLPGQKSKILRGKNNSPRGVRVGKQSGSSHYMSPTHHPGMIRNFIWSPSTFFLGLTQPLIDSLAISTLY